MTQFNTQSIICDECKQTIKGSYIASTTFFTMHRCMTCYKEKGEIGIDDYKRYIESR